MKTRILFLMALAASVSAFGTVYPVEPSGGTTVTVNLDSGTDTADINLNNRPSKTLIKTGAGRVNLTAVTASTKNVNDKFKGAIEVQGGTLGNTVGNKVYGRPLTVTVFDGASLLMYGGQAGFFSDYGTVTTISGTGVDGSGALQTSGAGTLAWFGALKLAADARINTASTGTMVFKGLVNGSVRDFEVGPYVLEKTGTGSASFRSSSLIASGQGGVKISGGSVDFSAEGGSSLKFVGTADNILEVCNGATNNLASIGAAPWTMKYTGSTASYLRNTSVGVTNVWEGPLVVSGVMRTEMADAGSAIKFAGPVDTTTTITLTAQNKGALIFTGDDPKTFDGRFAVSGGRVEFNGTKNVNLNEDSSKNTVSGGSSVLAFIDAGIVSNKNYNLRVYGDTVDKASRMIISGKTTFPVTTAQIGEVSGYGSDYRYGIVEIGTGAEIYNALGLGEDGYEIMSVYQKGGYWQLPSGGGNKMTRAPIGHNSTGYYELSGGTFRTFGGTGALTVGNNGVNASDVAGEGAFAMSGGEFNSGVLKIGVSGDGTWYQTGGTATLSKFKAKDEVEELLVAGTGSGFGQVTLSGETAVMNLGNGAYGSEVSFGSASGASTAILNLNDGASLVYYKLHKKADAADGSKFYLNFNGGILKPGNCWQAIGADYGDKQTAVQKPDAVTIYEGGLNIDISKALNGSGNPDTTFIDCDLTAPAGGSIVSIEIPDSLKSVRYIHRPRVYIEGDGYGASAVADFDSAAGRVKGIIVTSPGFGYAAANTTCKIASNSFQKQADRLSNATPCTVTVGTVRGGGVRMVGAGNRLVLSGKNSYAGVTVCENGSIKFNSAAAYPDGSGLAVWKGKDISSYIKLPGATPVNAGSLAGDGRLVCGNVAGVTNVVADAAKLFADGATPLTVDDHDEDDKLQSGCGNVTLAANAKVTVTGMRELVDAAGGAEAFAQAMTGKKLLVAKAGLTGTIASVELPGLTAEEAKFFKASVSGNAVKFGKNFGTVIILR